MPDGDERKVSGRAGGARDARAAWLLLGAAGAALALAARLWRLADSCLWFDELFGLHAARHAWGDLLRFAALDLVHPPLFYLLLKGWTLLGGESAWWLRLLPAVLSSLAAVPVALLARELRLSARTAALALLLFAASGFLIKYAQEVRMYAPLLLLASCSLLFFARLCRAGDEDAASDEGEAAAARRGRRRSRFALFALAAANLLLVYTHYFGWLLVLIELAFAALWARRRLKPLALSAALLAVCFAPWGLAVARAAQQAGGGLEQNIGWAARPGARELPLPYLLLHEPFRFQRHSAEPAVLRLTVAATLLVFAPALAALLFRELGRRRTRRAAHDGTDVGDETAARDGRDEINARRATGGRGETDEGGAADGRARFALRFLGFFSAAPVAAAFVLSQLLPQSVWGTRHLAVVAPAYLLLAAHAVTVLRPRLLSYGLQLLLGCWLLLALAGWLTRRGAPLVWCSWEALAAPLARAEAGAGRTANVYAAEELAAYHLWHALDGRVGGDSRFRVAVVKNLPGVVDDRAFFLPRGFGEVATLDATAALGADEFWLAFRAPAAEAHHPPLAELAARGYETGPSFEATAQGQRVMLVRARRR